MPLQCIGEGRIAFDVVYAHGLPFAFLTRKFALAKVGGFLGLRCGGNKQPRIRLKPYDNGGRRGSLTVPGQAVANYTFDSANRLSQITQGSTTVSFGYDNANRRTTVTLPNGVVTSYSYDGASQLAGITYQNGSTTLGNLSYSYDLLGRGASVAGSYARTGLPLAVNQTAYNVNNQLTTWGTANLFYDMNGNMTSDGTHSYTWDTRNRLKQIDLGNTASFTYDPFGRRATKSIVGTTTTFLYDGANAVQELIGGTNTANSLGGGIDEVFQRTDSAGARSFLADPLGSTLALADSTGTMQTSYSFEPFGNTTVSGSATTNSFAYTGRELDFTGLQFNRARCYNPTIGRFISEDPLGFAGSGPNSYAYVFDSPTNLVDPFGLAPGDWWDPSSYDFSHYDPWDTVQDVGNAAEAFTDSLTFGSASRLNDAFGAGGAVNRCSIGHKLGTAAGVVAGIAMISNISSWAKNPLLYEAGSMTLPSAVYKGIQGMTATQKGGYLLYHYGWMGILKLAGQAALGGDYAATIGTGLTPGGWLAVLGASQATSSLTKPKCGCK
jgi:RHS repeat-associated protein